VGFHEHGNDITHYNLDGGFEGSLPLTGIAIPFFNNGANGFSCLFSRERQDTESEPGRHNFAVKGTLRDESMRSRD
jgi:hypothetical protein